MPETAPAAPAPTTASTAVSQGSTSTQTTQTPPTPAAASKTEPTEQPSLLNQPQGAPEKYADFTVPDGWEMDQEVRAEAEKLFRDFNLPQSAAQALVDFYAAKSIQAQNAPVEFYAEMRQGWRESAMSHPELQGKLGAGGEVLTTISRGLDAIASATGDRQLIADFKEAMDMTGAGDHPAFIRVMYSLAKRATESGHVRGNGPSAAGQARPGSVRSAAQLMYPDLPSSSS
jgi:hypothetical protein